MHNRPPEHTIPGAFAFRAAVTGPTPQTARGVARLHGGRAFSVGLFGAPSYSLSPGP